MLKAIPALAALAVSATLLIPTIAHAQETRSVRVTYADLNLVTDIGQERLQRRISFAAKSVCETPNGRDYAWVRTVKACQASTVADAQPAFQEAVVRAHHPSVRVLETAALVVRAK